MKRPWRTAVFTAVVASSACGGGTVAPPRTAPRTSMSLGAGRPSLTVVERDGDVRGAVGIAVTTEGIAPERGAIVAVALGALVEERLAAQGVQDLAVALGSDGWRLRALVDSPADAARLIDATRLAMLSPVLTQDPALPAVLRRVAALSRRALADPGPADVARCTGEAYGAGGDTAPTEPELETWRRAAHGLRRVAVATAGDGSLADAVAAALARGPSWPAAAETVPPAWPAPEAPPSLYDASGELAPGAARIVVTVRTSAPERAVAASVGLSDPRGPLASRLRALDAPGRVRSVVATAHPHGGCVAVTIDVLARDLVSDAPVRIATAAALARQELAVEVADAVVPPDLGRALATRASDPRDAAELAAWWRLAGRGSERDDLRVRLVVGLAPGRDGLEPRPVDAKETSPRHGPRTLGAQPLPLFGDAMRDEIERAETAWRAPVVEARTRIERGQGELWLLLGSPCGTLGESGRDAGAGAVAVTAAAVPSGGSAPDGTQARVEPFIAADGIGVLAHGPPRAGESSSAFARRLADDAARPFVGDAPDPDRVGRARTALLARIGDVSARALAALAGALAPNRPSWVEPLGTTFSLESSSDDAVAMRAAVLRSGPLRVAVIANADAAQADAAVRAVDRWVARRAGEPRVCPPLPTPMPVRAGTYAVSLPAGATSAALLAMPLPAGDPSVRAAARWVAAALDGPAGLLARALGGSTQGERGSLPLASAWSASVMGLPRSPAIVVRIVAGSASLDLAVAQTRSLLDHVRQGALSEDDRARASTALARAALSSALDPRTRVVELWRGETPAAAPALEALRAFASAALRDDAMVIVAARPLVDRAE